MRVVHPSEIANAKAARSQKARQHRLLRRLVILTIVITITILLVINNRPKRVVAPFQQTQSNENTTDSNNIESQQKYTFANFTAEEFKELYSSYSYPNTEQLITPPYITGDEGADNRIRELAEARGYKLRSVVYVGLAIFEDGLLIQPLALRPLQTLVQDAAQVGLDLRVTAAYRSIDTQRELFNERLYSGGVSLSDIALGDEDDYVVSVLHQVAPPGYSRHHTGFTVDLQCGESGLFAFEYSACYQWFAENNFLQLKQLGWVPSYPAGADMQGPEPEPWEYIWVGTDALYE